MSSLRIDVQDLASWLGVQGSSPSGLGRDSGPGAGSSEGAGRTHQGEKGSSKPLVIDCRGESDYAKGHVPGAVNLPAGRLQDPLSERGALLPWPELAQRLARVGIGAEGPVVLYDDSGLVPSARLFWILECFGRGQVQLLDGGIPGWQSAGFELESRENPGTAVPPLTVPVAVPDALALKSHIEEALEDPNTVIVDARSEAEYRGVLPTAKRNGHIPGAVHCNWEEHIRDLFDPTFRPLEELRERYRGLGLSPENQVIVYCRSGARSSHSYVTLRMLGYTRVRNYAGSWLEWGNDPHTPVESDV